MCIPTKVLKGRCPLLSQKKDGFPERERLRSVPLTSPVYISKALGLTIPEKHLLEEVVCSLDPDLSVPVQPEEFELAPNHVRHFVAVGGGAGATANHVGCQGMDLSKK